MNEKLLKGILKHFNNLVEKFLTKITQYIF
jgi:hypothetical protein